MISNGLSHSFMWELISKDDKKPLSSNIKTEFSVRYKLVDTLNDDNKMYQFFFDISDYQVRILFCLIRIKLKLQTTD